MGEAFVDVYPAEASPVVLQFPMWKRSCIAEGIGYLNHAHAVALYFLEYDFARIDQTLRVTPAMEPDQRITSGI